MRAERSRGVLMRIVQLAACIAVALVAGCSHEARQPEPSGVTNLQPDPGLLGDQADSALTMAAQRLNQIEEVRGLTEDVVTREALTWETRALRARMDRVANDMQPGKRAPTWLFRAHIDELTAEMQRATRAQAWALDQIRSEPSAGSAGASSATPSE